MKLLFINCDFKNVGPHKCVHISQDNFSFKDLFSLGEDVLLQYDIIVISQTSEDASAIVTSYATYFWDIYVPLSTEKTFHESLKVFDPNTKNFLCKRRHHPIPSNSQIPKYNYTFAISTRSPNFLDGIRPFLAQVSIWRNSYPHVDVNLLAFVSSFCAFKVKIFHELKKIPHEIQNSIRTENFKTIKLFVLSYNEESFQKAKEISSRYSWCIPYMIPNADHDNKWHENKFFLELPELPDVDYIGTIAYNCERKIDMEALNRSIKNNNLYLFDFISLCCMKNVHHFDIHPNFRTIWDDVMANKFGLCKADGIIETLFNFWIAKKDLFKEYTEFLKKICKELESHPLIMTDSKYSHLPKQHLKRMYGVEYYPHHPFLLERLARMYFEKQKKTIGKLSTAGRFVFDV